MKEGTTCGNFFMRNENLFKEKPQLVIFSKVINVLCDVTREMMNA